MRKLTFLAFPLFALLVLNSCKSSKSGCGLTSDATKIEQQTKIIQENTTETVYIE